jgi:hypothetical protein
MAQFLPVPPFCMIFPLRSVRLLGLGVIAVGAPKSRDA